ncbi:MAG: hypothetical protein IJT94_00125 [Oscillibacter sp.]|nr:hypothetical protein [Oscillibacter sp.]
MVEMENPNLPLTAGGSTITIDDGTREYTITNRFQQVIATVHFRPADFSMVDRCQALADDFPKIAEPLKNIKLRNDGGAAFEKDWSKIKEVEADLIGKIGEIFDTDDIAAIFAKRSAFSSVGGEFFSYRVIQALLNLVKGAVAEETRLSTQRMAPYLNDLETGNAGPASQGA